MVYTEIWPSGSRLWPRRPSETRSSLRGSDEIRIVETRDSTGSYLPACTENLRSSARSLEAAWQNQESVPKCRLIFWSIVPSLWLPRHIVLYRDLWREPRSGTFGTAYMGSCTWIADRKAEEYRFEGSSEAGRGMSAATLRYVRANRRSITSHE